MSTAELLKEYLQRKICYKCKKAQSLKRDKCFKCRGDLRLRKAKK